MMDSFWTSDSALVKQLYDVLRNNADHFCNGEVTLSLNPYAVKVLHDSFCRITNSDAKNPSFDVLPSTFIEFDTYRELLFVFDIAQRTTDLKVLQNGLTLNGCLSVAAFSKLTKLELNCIPLHYIYGIRTIRPTLRHLVCIGCFEKLENLFEKCGADKTEGQPWSALTEAHLPFNNLQHLDESLALIPEVRSLDLSHNSFSAGLNLHVLKHLKVLNLSFNELKKFPNVGFSLTSLNLRKNLLTSLDGIETLTHLTTLDLSYNLLRRHRLLKGLSSLEYLKELLIAFNPLCFLPDHRKSTILYLNSSTIHEILLDGDKLSFWEIKSFNAEKRTPVAGVVNVSPHREPIRAASRSEYSRKQLKKCRVRVIQLGEYDQDHTAHSEHQDWAINSVEAQDQSFDSSLLLKLDNDDSEAVQSRSPEPEGDDVSITLSKRHNAVRRKHINRNHSLPGSLSIASADAVGTIKQVAIQFPGNRLLSPNADMTVQSEDAKLDFTTAIEVHEMPVSSSEVSEMKTELSPERLVAVVALDKVEPLVDFTALNVSFPVSELVEPLLPSQEDDHADTEENVDGPSSQEKVDETDVYSMFRSKDVPQLSVEMKSIRPSTEDDLNSYCTVYEPLTQNHRFVNINATHFVVIEIGGGLPVIEEYRLSSLSSMKIVNETYELSPGEDQETVECTGPVIQLIFTGLKSTSIRLTYVMFDQEETKMLTEKLAPYIESNQTFLECLKCSQRFLDSQVTLKVKVTADAADVPLNFNKGSLTEVPVCPYCNSDLILELPSKVSTIRPSSMQEPAIASSVGLPQVLSGLFNFTRMGSCPQIVTAPKLTTGTPSSVEQPLSACSNSQLIPPVQSPSIVSYAKTMLEAVFDIEQSDGYTFYNNDFTKFDPRLSLDIDLNLFHDDNEKLVLLLKSPMTMCTKQQFSQFDGLLIVSTSKLYIAQLNSTSSAGDFNSWLKIRFKTDLKRAVNITVGFRGQTLNIEAPVDQITFSLLICSVDRCKRFINDISAIIAEYGLSMAPAICAKDRQSLNTLMQQLCDEFLLTKDKEPCFHGYAISQGYQTAVRHVAQTCYQGTVGVLVTMTHVCLVEEIIIAIERKPGTIIEPPDGAVQFKVLEKQTTNNIVHLDVILASPWKLTIHFENESDPIPVSWQLTLRNSCSAKELIDSMQDSYLKVFKVPLHINYFS